MADIENPATESKSNGFDKLLGSAGGALKVANGVAGLIDGIFGISAKRQENAQKRLMDKQQEQWKEQQGVLNDYMLAQWNRENEYNDPTNYYKRLLDGADANGVSKAGVLGNMPSGNVGVSASKNTAGGNVSTGVGSPSALGLGNASALAGLRQRAEIENIESQTAKNYADAGLSDAKTTTEQLQWNIKQSEFDLNNALTAEAKERKNVLKQEKIYKENQNRVFDAVTQSEITRNFGEFLNSLGSLVSDLSDASLTEDRRQEIQQKIKESAANTALAYAYRDSIELNMEIPKRVRDYFNENPEMFNEYVKAYIDLTIKERNWFTADRLVSYVTQVASSAGDLFGGIVKGLLDLDTIANGRGPKTTSTIETWTDSKGKVRQRKSTDKTESR